MSLPEGDLETKKTEKYDRQLRLWGVEGQKRIESAHIALLNGGPVGTETLKNLVLPGIGEFTVIDSKKVTNRDLGNNFFVESESIGKSRAEEVTRLLYELNDMVKDKHAIDQDPVALIDSNADFVKDYTVIIATELPPTSVVKLSIACAKHNKILIVVRINGLIGTIRVQAGEHTIVESKPSFPSEDLRLNTPFEAISQIASRLNYDNLDDMHFAHIPYPIILLKEIETWKAAHNKLPEEDNEKDKFRAQIQARKRKVDNENFSEASQKAHYAWIPYKIPSTILDILNDHKAQNVTKDSTDFWLLAHAVNLFVHNEGKGKLPLMGTIPDMTSDTHSFIELQYAYRDKALQDADIVKHHLHKTLTSLGLPTDRISDVDIRNFCKHSLFLQVIRYSTVAEEDEDPSKVNRDSIEMNLVDWLVGDDAPGEGCWWLAMRAADRFHRAHGRYPGENTDAFEQDFESLRKHADDVLTQLGFQTNQLQDAHLKELCRFGNSQIHTIAAILGGICAQEVIKLVTHQWVPLDNTFVFNGIHSTSVSLKI
eukprot:TRINITY_DN669_c0_g1_i1.p1 TRINITY_DN669_c0_g1~~TRINITY_DN669_c0_g1_i1.p1  ORF type:complete len:540 (+),score=116.60 TRINITY_DN669_c0_g1_i1:122-1741(+)